ncbi:type II toxin-antitoxin system PemK/MazF family toxin [Candidatus Synechococcus calcipolaris G9]|uniref:Type II toxin-antitoxin system PemK/MazF family toxin n=1 Tax=Candidatus Synechococcus calcipolaris G9 TaxID=1497997 RepID=A0ABT6F1A8_9SYNE|nr:type II toxin-antitoxin system PemK/MazF family toxin [Candidatus Synechococcus calcipolaris]MDG2991619.1 type II toxin-antitoxin system PemK/MazF family toxin [Candidatus Synechococcus calcipolaris G9]
MSLRKGDVVLVPFPFTDLSQTKLRPAVVLCVDSQRQDITLCFISSQNLKEATLDEVILTPDELEFSQTGLKVASKIRVTRIVTLEYHLLQRRLGGLGQQQLQRLNEALRFAFQLN